MKLTVIGPNLRDQSKGDFHVHAAGCADVTKSKYRGDQKVTGEFASRKDIVVDIYSPGDFDYDEKEWQRFDDVYLFPCVVGLPAEVAE